MRRPALAVPLALAALVAALPPAAAQPAEALPAPGGALPPSSTTEIPAAPPPPPTPSRVFTRLDEDRNGVLVRDEAEADAEVERQWPRLDRNGDGFVSRAEFTKHYRMPVR